MSTGTQLSDAEIMDFLRELFRVLVISPVPNKEKLMDRFDEVGLAIKERLSVQA